MLGIWRVLKSHSDPKFQVQPTLHPPRAAPDHLRLQSFQILSRLSLIPAFRPWLIHTRHHVPRRRPTPLELLYDCFAFGAPLGTLLALLGSPVPNDSGGYRHMTPEEFNFLGITMEERERYFQAFVLQVQMMEAQGKVAYGEVLRAEDFLSGTAGAFGKVLRTVYRLLVTLEEIYPGIFSAPVGALERRFELLEELIETERAHLGILGSVFEAVATLSKSLDLRQPCLECIRLNRGNLLQYHERLLTSAEDLVTNPPAMISWTEIFGLDDDGTRAKVFAAYRILCIDYLGLMGFLNNTEFELHLMQCAQVIRENISTIISRISNYTMILQDILDTTLPTDDRGYNSLCEAVLRMDDIVQTMNEAGQQLRTMSAAHILRSRVYVWTAPEPDDLGVLLLDDCISGISDTLYTKGKPTLYSVFLYEALLLCCTEGFDKREARPYEQTYPICSWELGPALRRKSPLDIVHAISVVKLDSILCPDTSSMQIKWVDTKRVQRHIAFIGMSYPQWEQWLTTLEPFVLTVSRPPVVPRLTFDQGKDPISEDEDEDGNMQAHARPWSVIARKAPRSEASSFINLQCDIDDDFLAISPGVLPNLFHNNAPESLRSPSPLNLNYAVVLSDESPTSPSHEDTSIPSNPRGELDLTGKVTRQGRYPVAHGGFSDVWKGVWYDGERPRNVAVKVLRSKINDPDLEEKMIGRLGRELSIWKGLDHPNILGLLGTASDFGPYSSMVCPWMENGSVSKHMERCGDIMSTSDRMKILCEVAKGLSYLHERSIVHGDLTGSNVLITDDGTACVCDFGLSSIAAEFQGTSFMASNIGGAVRWADALLYRLHTDSEDDESVQRPPMVNMPSDVYSYGSLMLEILSGRIPYHYIRTDVQVVIELHKGVKPRRPAQSFVSDQQWAFITRCWSDDPDTRPPIQEVCETVQTFYESSLS